MQNITFDRFGCEKDEMYYKSTCHVLRVNCVLGVILRTLYDSAFCQDDRCRGV